jgi:hypothetical protein
LPAAAAGRHDLEGDAAPGFDPTATIVFEFSFEHDIVDFADSSSPYILGLTPILAPRYAPVKRQEDRMALKDLKGRIEAERRTEKLRLTVSPTVAEKLRELARKYEVSMAVVVSELITEAE